MRLKQRCTINFIQSICNFADRFKDLAYRAFRNASCVSRGDVFHLSYILNRVERRNAKSTGGSARHGGRGGRSEGEEHVFEESGFSNRQVARVTVCRARVRYITRQVKPINARNFIIAIFPVMVNHVAQSRLIASGNGLITSIHVDVAVSERIHGHASMPIITKRYDIAAL